MTEFPSFDLSGQTALVSGAARGLGRAIALALAHAGADVALVEIPMRPDYDRQIRQARRDALSGPAFAALLKRVRDWDIGSLDAGLYCDLTHVTPAGQALTTGRLESRVAEALAQPAG